jgi:hypothetical protein
MTVYLVISLPKIPYIHRKFMVLANPKYFHYNPMTSYVAANNWKNGGSKKVEKYWYL